MPDRIEGGWAVEIQLEPVPSAAKSTTTAELWMSSDGLTASESTRATPLYAQSVTLRQNQLSPRRPNAMGPARRAYDS